MAGGVSKPFNRLLSGRVFVFPFGDSRANGGLDLLVGHIIDTFVFVDAYPNKHTARGRFL